MKKNNIYRKYMIELSIGILMLILGLLLTTFGGLKVNDGWKKISEIKLENIVTADESVEFTKTDSVIAEKYFTSMNLFLLKFRMILYSYYIENKLVTENIEKSFNLTGFNKNDGKGVNLELVDSLLIKEVFSTFDFEKKTGVRFKNMKPVIPLSDTLVFQFFLPESINPPPKDSINGYNWFMGEIQDLKKGCTEILTRYGSVGNTKLIDNIERLIYSINGVERHFSQMDLAVQDSFSIKTVEGFLSNINHHINYVRAIDSQKNYAQQTLRMKIDIVTKTRNTKWKNITLILLLLVSILTFLLSTYDIIGDKIMGFVLLTSFLLFVLLGWLKNYKVDGFIELGENLIRVYKNGNLIQKIDYEADEIKTVTIKWEAFTDRFVRLLSGYLYLDTENASLEIENELHSFSFDIVLEQYKKDRKPIDFIFNKLEGKGISTGYERKKNYAQQFIKIIRAK